MRDAFGQRRKTIRNTLKKPSSALEELEQLWKSIHQARPEVLLLADFVRIADYLIDRAVILIEWSPIWHFMPLVIYKDVTAHCVAC